MTRNRFNPARRTAGFTLAEVMFAVLLLGIGLIAVASLFPVAGAIQRDTVDDVVAMSIGRSAEATLLGKKIDQLSLASVGSPLQKVPGIDTSIPLADRSFPMTEPDVTKRKYYWVPLVRKDPAKGFQFYVFIMRTIGSESPDDARVNKTTAALAGDVTITDAGQLIQRTTDTANEANWHGESAGAVSRAMHIIVVGEGAVR